MSAFKPTEKELLLDAIAQSLGQKAIETVEPQEVEEPEEEEEETELPQNGPVCMTQKALPRDWKPNGVSDIVVGFNNECPRWVPGSVIRWAAWRQGFETQEDADYAAMQLAIAADAWNKADIGVTFEWVHLAKDATFVLYHAGNGDGTLAQAFFPNGDDLSSMLVFSDAFTPEWKPNMWKIFTHELGHVLGLRHEFAIAGLPIYGIRAEKQGAVRLGKRDPKSVMTYAPEPPEIQESDIESTKMFYSLKPDEQGNPPKVGFTKVKDYIPS
ncbi:hypothetical protein LB506_011641 [Fusarium annulatum]|uniref:Peptidase M10 metallopeptidase domain-containing protein n=1 Tax=Gibberella intermedia TaxID=948311 RepID=A0A365MVP4_GIBIN|nr:hypothetical protein LB506_011641 [Fusarium annulatum]RBA12621.1 hypothetical protein FPRO05_04071 [Fusarium proliferatum]